MAPANESHLFHLGPTLHWHQTDHVNHSSPFWALISFVAPDPSVESHCFLKASGPGRQADSTPAVPLLASHHSAGANGRIGVNYEYSSSLSWVGYSGKPREGKKVETSLFSL